MSTLMAISLWEPWASAMRLDLKRNETRHWGTGYHGDLAICSAKRKMGDLEWEIARRWLPSDFVPQYGLCLCVVEIYDCQYSDDMDLDQIGEQELALGDYGPGRRVWMTRRCRPLIQPAPIRGQQGMWQLDFANTEAINQRL